MFVVTLFTAELWHVMLPVNYTLSAEISCKIVLFWGFFNWPLNSYQQVSFSETFLLSQRVNINYYTVKEENKKQMITCKVLEYYEK